jgi:hypothetical protein
MNIAWLSLFSVCCAALAAFYMRESKTPINTSDIDFMQQFLTQTLPFEKWTHRNHVRLAYITTYLITNTHSTSDSSVEELIYDRVKRGIQQFNAKHHEKLQTGYHETITRYWVRSVLQAFTSSTGSSFDNFWEIHPNLQYFNNIFKHYSREKLYSAHAKSEYIPEDF